MNKITIGVPAFRAQKTIPTLLASVLMQSFAKECVVVIANDDPEENGTYEFVKALYPTLDIRILDCEKNTGPGLSRQRALDACITKWITFMDADDVFLSPYAIENLLNNTTPNCVEVFGTFFQEVEQGCLTAAERMQLLQTTGQCPPRMMPRNDAGHPWVFGRMYNVEFLKKNDIRFSELRAMEDGEFNWKVNMIVQGSKYTINRIEDPIYLWKTGSDHSITRIGIDENDGEPLYNWDLCQVGATAAAINAIKFCQKKNPFNGGIIRFAVEQMVGQYFTYVKCLAKKPMFAEQNLWNAKRFYELCYKEMEKTVEGEIVQEMYTALLTEQSKDMIGIIPEITFFDFMKKIKEEGYGGENDFYRIRAKFPDWVKQLDLRSGVLGEEGFIYCDCEEKPNK